MASLLNVLSVDREVMRYCSKPELEKLLNPDNYIGTSVQQVERVIEKLSGLVR
jgi:adenylosuccinate lyase